MPQLIVGPCAKCGCERIATLHVPRREDYEVGYRAEDTQMGEHLRHRCENCRYAWNTAPLDLIRETPSGEIPVSEERTDK